LLEEGVVHDMSSGRALYASVLSNK
jgi:hypothetical protein